LARDAAEPSELSAGTLDRYRERGPAVKSFVERLASGPVDAEMAEAAAELSRWARAKKRTEVADACAAYLERPDLVGAMIDDVLSRHPDRRARAAAIAARAGMKEAPGRIEESLERRPEQA